MAPGRSLRFDQIAEARRQWRAHGWAAPDAMAAATSIMRAQQLVLAAVEAELRPFELTFARYEVLVLLTFSRQGSLPLGKMGERLMVHPTSVTNAIDRLEAQGYVKRLPHPDDRRTVLAGITPAGRRVVHRATAAVTDAQFGVHALTSREARELAALVRRMRAAHGDFEEP